MHVNDICNNNKEYVLLTFNFYVGRRSLGIANAISDLA